MKKYFEEQLKTSSLITDDSLKELKGKSIYSDYQVGDRIVAFLSQESEGFVEAPNDIVSPIGDNSKYVPRISFNMCIVVEREIDKLDEEYCFIRMSSKIPVLEKKEF
jgi:hypothetical protein